MFSPDSGGEQLQPSATGTYHHWFFLPIVTMNTRSEQRAFLTSYPGTCWRAGASRCEQKPFVDPKERKRLHVPPDASRARPQGAHASRVAHRRSRARYGAPRPTAGPDARVDASAFHGDVRQRHNPRVPEAGAALGRCPHLPARWRLPLSHGRWPVGDCRGPHRPHGPARHYSGLSARPQPHCGGSVRLRPAHHRRGPGGVRPRHPLWRLGGWRPSALPRHAAP